MAATEPAERPVDEERPDPATCEEMKVAGDSAILRVASKQESDRDSEAQFVVGITTVNFILFSDETIADKNSGQRVRALINRVAKYHQY